MFPSDRHQANTRNEVNLLRQCFPSISPTHAAPQSPWGYTNTLPVDYDIQNGGSKVAVDALAALYGTQFDYGPSGVTIYETSGASDDYAYGAAGIIFSCKIDLWLVHAKIMLVHNFVPAFGIYLTGLVCLARCP